MMSKFEINADLKANPLYERQETATLSATQLKTVVAINVGHVHGQKSAEVCCGLFVSVARLYLSSNTTQGTEFRCCQTRT